MSSNKSKKRIM